MWATKAAFGVVDPETDACLVTNDFPIFRARENLLVPKLMSLVFAQSRFQHTAAALATGTTERRRLKEDAFLSISVLLPPLSEQRRILDMVTAVDGAILAAQNELSAAESASNALVTEILGGVPERSELGQVAEVTIGRQRSPKHASGPHMKMYLRAANVKDGKLDLSDVLVDFRTFPAGLVKATWRLCSHSERLY
jgi:type I restriction enzyme S subunit